MFEDKNEGSKSEKKLENKAANNGLTPRVSFFSGQLIISGDVTITSRGEASLNGSLNLENATLVERYKKHRPVYTQEHSNIQNNTHANGVISAFGHVCLESEEEGVILNVDPEERSFNV